MQRGSVGIDTTANTASLRQDVARQNSLREDCARSGRRRLAIRRGLLHISLTQPRDLFERRRPCSALREQLSSELNRGEVNIDGVFDAAGVATRHHNCDRHTGSSAQTEHEAVARSQACFG